MTLSASAIQPTAFADVAVGLEQPADRDPEFLDPDARPRNGVVHPEGDAPATRAEVTPTGRIASDTGQPGWATHAEAREAHAEAAALARTSGKRVLVTGRLAEDSTTYANPDGTTTTELTSGPSRIRRGDGWADVDTTLVRRGNRWEAAQIVGRLSLSKGGDREVLTLGRGAHSFSLEWPTTLPEPRIAGSTATYPNVRPGTDLVIRALRYGYEQSIVLHERPAEPVSFELGLRLTGRDTARVTEQGIDIEDADGSYVGRLPKGFMFDARRDPRTDEPARHTLVPTTLAGSGDDLRVRYAPDAAWLADPETVYPVTIDPPATLGLTTDTYVDSYYPTMNYQGTLDIHVGSHNSGVSIDRSFISFGTSAIAGTNVISATLKLYQIHAYSCTDRPMTVRATAHSSTATTWNNQPSWYAQYDPDTSFADGYSTSCPDKWQLIPATNLVQQWATNGTSTAALGLRAPNETTDNYQYRRFNSGNAGSGHPTIAVTYNSIPTVTSPSPATGTVVNDLTPDLSGIVNDDDGGTVTGQFYLKNSAGAWVSNGPTRSGTEGTRITYTVESGKLQDGQTYTWYMRGCDGTDCSPTTASRTFTVNYGPPGAPATASATAGDSTTTVTWTAPTDNGGSTITGYRCDLHNAGTGAVHRTTTVDDLVKTCTDNTVVNGTSYYWKIYAINAAGTGTARQSGTVTPSRLPGPPTNVVATEENAASTLTWGPPESNGGAAILDYTAKLYRKDTPTVAVHTETVVPTATLRSRATNLTNGVTYFWTVAARNTRGSTAAQSADVTPATRPGTPVAVTATEQERPLDEVTDPANPPSTVTYTVAWQRPLDDGGAPILDYTVQAYEMPARTPVLQEAVVVCGECFSAQVGGLKPGRRYVFGVKARNRVDHSIEGESSEYLSHLPPRVDKTVAYSTGSLATYGSAPVAGRGDTVTYTVTVTNTQAQPAQVDSVVDTLPAGVSVSAVTVDGVPCDDGCALNGSMLTLSGGYVLAPGATRRYEYVAVLTGAERACLANAVNRVVARGPYGLDAGTAATTTCGSALGLEPWWTYLSFPVAAQSAASVNVANGNLVVQATDGAPVQAHGRLAYVLRRSYNSQDVTVADLPGSLGTGWSLNVGQTTDLAATGVTATAVRVPRVGDVVSSLTQPLAVTLIDRDGTRHAFTPKTGLPALRVGALTGAAAVLRPATLTAPSGQELCVDVAYDAPAGVHLGLWRFVAVDTDPDADPCANVGDGNPVVMGYAAMRPDRVRTEYDVFGRLVELRDGAGVALRYTYEAATAERPVGRLVSVWEPRSCASAPAAGSTCRQLRFTYEASATVATDPAGRRTRYEFATAAVTGVSGTVKVRRRVVNEPELRGEGDDYVQYWYQGETDANGQPVSCGGSALQLCSTIDARGHDTAFHYDTATSIAGGLAGLGRIDRITDRVGTQTTVAYPAGDRAVAVKGGTQQRAFHAIDSYGRVGEQLDGPVGDASSSSYAALHHTLRTWDGDSGCSGSSGERDNNLCEQTRRGPSSDNDPATVETPDEATSWVYDAQGNVLRERREHRNADGTIGIPANLDTTFGYRTQYVGGDATGLRAPAIVTSSTGPGGVVTTSGTAALDGFTTVYALSDRIERLSPKGNATATEAGAARYRTRWDVDADEDAEPSRDPGTEVCPLTGTAASNTGLVCAEHAPYGAEGDSTVATTRHQYDTFGQKRFKVTPRGGEYEYDYFTDGQLDLSGQVSAGGWLRAVTDPAERFVAFGYDRAGNVARTWDRDATARARDAEGRPYDATTFPVGIGIAGFTETRYAAGTFEQALLNPWRFPRRQQTPTGDVIRMDVDRHGNVERLVPPRGKGAATSPYDVVTTYDPDGRVIDVRRGSAPATSVTYDAFGNVAVRRDKSGTATVMTFDAVNRLVKRETLRGTYVAEDAPTACRETTAADTEFGAGKLVCTETTAYDTLDNVVATQDRDGQRTESRFDSVRRRTVTLTPRSATEKLRSQWVYDPDGRVTIACSPRQFPNGIPATCGESSIHATHTSYDVAGRVASTTVHRTGDRPLTTHTTYDADGNPIAIADPRQALEGGDHTVNQVFDRLGRRTSVDVPRAGTTTYHYSPSGNLLAEVAPGAVGDNIGLGGAGRDKRITAYTYDASHRVLDTVRALQVAAADPANDLAGITDAVGDAVTSESAQTNIRTRRAYDAHGNVAAFYSPRAFVGAPVTDPDERFMLRTDYDENDRPVTQWAPRADDGSFADLTGDPIQPADCPATGMPDEDDPLAYPEGVHVCVSTMTYDDDGRVTQVTLPTEADDQTPPRMVYEYTEDDLVRETKAPSPADDNTLVAVSTVVHDGVGHPVKTTNALGHVTLTAYTSDGLVRRVETPGTATLTHVTELEYDENGNRVREITPRPSAGDRPYTETAYYADGRVQAIYAGGNYPADGTPVRGDIVTSYDYDGNGNPTEVTSPSANARDDNNLGGEPTRNSYTADNLLAETVQPVVVAVGGTVQARVTTYAYDAAGRKTSVDVDLTGTPAANGDPQAFSYFPTGLVKTETGRGGTDTITRGYDATGALVAAVDSNGITARSTTVDHYLDGLPRRVVSDNRVTAYAYSGSGARTSLGEGALGGPLDVTWYAVNDAGVTKSMTSGDAGTITWAYNALGQLVTETRGPRTQTWTYRTDDLLDRTVVRASGADIASFAYDYDELGRQTEQTYYGKAATSPVDDVAAGSAVTYSYAYDRAGRLSSFTDARGTRTLTFDHNGNRTDYGTGVQPGATKFTYRADDSIATSVSGLTTRTYEYDDPFGGVTDDGCAAYDYDGLDRLVSVDTPPAPQPGCASGDVSFAYDGFDRQVRRTAGGETVSLHYAGLDSTVLLQTGAAAGPLHFSIDESGTVKTARRGSGTVEHLAEDGTGSTGLLTDAAGDVQCTARYDAYGNPDGNTPVEVTSSCNTGSAQSDVFYRGNRKDTATGQYQLGSRTYDPAKAGFLMPDVYRTGDSDQNVGVGTDPLTRNSYAYVNGDPVNFIDPWGHEPHPVMRDGKTTWSGNGCATGGCTGDNGREMQKFRHLAWQSVERGIDGRLAKLDEWKKRDRNAYWDAVYRDCDQYKAAGVSPGALYCEQMFRVTIGLQPYLPQEDFAHSLVGVVLGLDDIVDCGADQKVSACIFAAISLIPTSRLGKLRKLDEMFDVARLSDNLAAAEKHLASIEGALDYGPNKAMLDSIRDAARTGRPLTLPERNFLAHELLEADLVAKGMSLEDAHAAVYKIIPPGANYSPEVIEQFSDHFSPTIQNYWKNQ